MVLHNCQSPADRHATLSGGFMSLCAIANECVAVLALQTLREVAEDLPSMLWWRCDDGGTILHAACTRGHADVVRSVVRMLQGYGAEGAQGVDLGTLLHMTDAEGRFPLYIAVTRGDLALVHLLLSVGASPNSGRATTVGRFSSSNSPIVTVSTCVEAAFASAAWSVLRELIGAGACVSDFTRRVLPVSLQPVVEFLHECVEVVDAVFARVEALRGAPYPQAVFSPSTTDREVGRYLAAWGLSPQKPVRRAYERNDAAIARWLKREYPAIARDAKREGATIYWGDEMGLRSDHVTGTSYALVGRTPVVRATGQRFGCSMISAITNRGQLAFRIFHGTLRAPMFVDFMRRLRRQSAGKVYLIVDGHPVHRSRIAQQFVADHAADFRLIQLPGYCPELNPDELLNQDVKTNALGKSRPRNRDEMMTSVRRHLYRRQKQPHLIRNLFQERHVRYAA